MRKIHPKDIGLANPRFIGKPRRKAKEPKTPEAVTQDLVEQYLGRLGIPYLHIPAFLLNAAFAMRGQVSGGYLGAMRNAAEAVRGFPDIVAFDPDRQSYCGIELKSRDGRMTGAQEMWQKWLRSHEARSFEEAKAIIDAWRAPAAGPPSPAEP